MNSTTKLSNYAAPVIYLATAVMAASFAEGVAQILGFSLVAGKFSAGRILDIAATLYLFGIALLLARVTRKMHDS